VPTLVLVGPTAVGKSAVVAALAARRPLEVVVADSLQVYRGLDVGTAKPTPAERARIPHHLLDLRDPTEPFTAADFAALAKRYSEDSHAEDGGLMDWVAQGELMPELDAALFSLAPGEVSAPIQTRLGLHLLHVEERRSAASLSVTEAHRAVYQQLYQRKFQHAFARWLAQLKRRAYIDILSEG